MNKTQTKEEIKKLQSEINFRSMCFAQMRQCDLTASEIIYELFDDYLAALNQKITKPNYELTVQAWVEERAKYIISESSSQIKTIVRLRFSWEPVEKDAPYLDVKFNKKQLVLVERTLSLFSSTIGYEVELINEF